MFSLPMPNPGLLNPSLSPAGRFHLGLIALGLGLSLVVGGGFPAASPAQVPPPLDPGGPGRPSPRWLRDLNLTPEQTRQIEAIQEQSRGRVRDRLQNLRQTMDELQGLMGSNATESQLRDRFRQFQDLQRELAEQRFNELLAIRKVLTPEQRQQLRTRMEAGRPLEGERPRERMREKGKERAKERERI